MRRSLGSTSFLALADSKGKLNTKISSQHERAATTLHRLARSIARIPEILRVFVNFPGALLAYAIFQTPGIRGLFRAPEEFRNSEACKKLTRPSRSRRERRLVRQLVAIRDGTNR